MELFVEGLRDGHVWPPSPSPGVSAFGFAYHEGPGNITVEIIEAAFVPVPGVCDTPGSPFCPPTSGGP